MKSLLFYTLLSLAFLSCSDNGSPYIGSGSDDNEFSVTGQWIADLETPSNIFYVRPVGSVYGSGDGSSWDNAFSGLPAVRQRNSIYYFASGEYFDESLDRIENYIFDDADAGEEFIFIVKATLTDHGSDEGFEESFAEGSANLGPLSFIGSRYVIDGNTPGGFVINHRNCDIRETDFVASPIFFPWNSVSEYLLIKNTEIYDCGHHTDPTVRSQDALYGVAGVKHFAFISNYIHDAWRNLFFLQDSYDLWIEGNHFERSGMHHEASTIALRNSRNIVIRRNMLTDTVNDFISLQSVRNVVISSNILQSTLEGWEIWSAIFSQEPAKNVLIAGNTFYKLAGLNTGIRFTDDTDDLRVINNIWASNRTNQIMLNGTHSSNAFYDNYRVDGANPVYLDDNIDEDTKQVFTSDPFVSADTGDFCLTAPTDIAEETGSDFASVDYSGTPRGTDGNPDRGSCEYE
ncbi:right-handed parallel beta-helix repeat-containing protein [Myxococcota bacterium]|nr:right-handed parallel beta-helix repeat-containing protein [Myxococcota bacterium]MBU1381560.1 right-handed parallel beta-helix repeat-containing protein [Myxococcota bacterium]MBU1496076.1 right-handed parallel beta-helix repeat-containing protein [Myxococcota bacterium]